MHYVPRPGARADVKALRADRARSNHLAACDRRRAKQHRTLVRRLRRAGAL
jgi:hypothetical protein